MKLSVIFRYLNLSGERVHCKTVTSLFHLCTVLLGQGFLFLFSSPFPKEIPKFLSMKKDKEQSHKNNLFQKKKRNPRISRV